MAKAFATFVFVIVFGVTHAQSPKVGPDEKRVQWEKVEFESFLAGEAELTSRQSLLFSLKVPVGAAQLDDYASRYNIDVLSIYLCSGQAAMGVMVPQGVSVARRSQTLEVHPLLRAPHAADEMAPESESDLAAGDFKFCGFRARMARSDLRSFTGDIKGKIMSVEVSNGRMLNLPINRWKIYGPCPSCA